MPEVRIRKRLLMVEEIFHEGGPVAHSPQRRAAQLVVIRNPYAGGYVEKIEGFMEDLKPLGLEMAQSLVTALNANDTTGISNAITSLDAASTYVNQQQAYYGSAEQTLTSEQNNAASQVTALQVQIGNIRDTNVPQAATELTQLSTDQSAAYASQAAIPTKSLFDYLG